MTRRHFAGWQVLAVAAWACPWICTGCGNSQQGPLLSASMEEATVTGIVRVRGTPVTNGRVGFRAANINRPNAPYRETEIGKDGRYTIKALIGDNTVDVTCKELAQPKNRQFIDNNQTIRVSSGENQIDIDIPRKARPVDPPVGSG
jgi:hypothetical protein